MPKLLISVVSTAVIIGTMSVTFALSLAAIIYSGPLAPHLGDGIVLTLLGATAMAIVSPFVLSYRGTLIQPQDITAILLALSAAGIVTSAGLGPDQSFATVVALIAVASIATGAVAYLMGTFRLGHLVRFIPFPVISGFLAATGALLVRGAFNMVIPEAPAGFVPWFASLVESWPLWLPWLAVAVVMVGAERRFGNGGVIPAVLLASLVAFFVVILALGLDIATAQQGGLMLGPFGDSSLGIGSGFFGDIQWELILSQAPVILAIVGIAILGTLLNASGLELALEQDIDLEKDLKGVGIANVLAGLCGGLVGFHILAETLLARRLGAVGAIAGLTVAAACALALFLGAWVFSYLPIGLFAAVIWYLGLELVLTAVADHGRRMPWLDLAIVIAAPVIALAIDFMAAVAFGVVVAAAMFVVAYSRVETLRLSTTGANLRARVERRPELQSRLTELGRTVQIHKLDGFLFFGSASRLFDQLKKRLDVSPPPRFAIVDLKRVVGLDMSAWAAFERLSRSCAHHGTTLVLTGLAPHLRTRFRDDDERRSFEVHDSLDELLLRIEDQLLAESGDTGAPVDERVAALEERIAGLMIQFGIEVTLEPGGVLIEQGARSDHVIMLRSGRCRAVVADPAGVSRTVNRLLPGAILGEIAFYAGVPRTASVVAETQVTALQVDAASLARMEAEDPALAAQFHRLLATVLSRRLMAVTRLLNDAEL